MIEEITATELKKLQIECIKDCGDLLRKRKEEIRDYLLDAYPNIQGSSFWRQFLEVFTNKILKEEVESVTRVFDKINGW